MGPGCQGARMPGWQDARMFGVSYVFKGGKFESQDLQLNTYFKTNKSHLK